MSNITPSTPSFVFGYWRPWKENSNVVDSYLDYTKEVSLVRYGADTVGKYINQASKEQVQAINQLGQVIGRGMEVLSNQMSDINDSLGFLNRNMDIQIEQQKLSNLLLQNIVELLRVPDSEKERQHSIELGIKFFVNAKKDSDLYADALEELLKAESLMKQDYFVLHRIGCIYLHVNNFINPEKALDYFSRAAKYASVESDSTAVKLANILTNNFNTVNSDINNSEKQIGLLAADSYEKAAFSAYVIGRFEDAVNYQVKALKFNPIPQNMFLLSKYQIRNNNIKESLVNLSECIDQLPTLAIAVFKEIDLINEPQVVKLIEEKNDIIDNKINRLIEKWKTLESTSADKVISELTVLSKKSYEIKVADFNKFEKEGTKINQNLKKVDSEIDLLIKNISNITYTTFDSNKISGIIKELEQAKDLPLEKMEIVFDKFKKELDADILKIGSQYEGGIVFYLDKSGKHGLVCTDKDLGNARWGSYGLIGVSGNGIADGSGMTNTKKIVELASWEWEKGFFGSSKKPVLTAARLCLESNHNGYNDWYLPTKEELNVLYKNKKKIGVFSTGNYRSSTECYNVSAWYQNFDNGYQDANDKINSYYIRAVRVF
jgi:hypothetical protein